MRNKLEVKKELSELYNSAKSKEYTNRDKVRIGKLTKSSIQRYKREIGIDLTGYTRVVFAQDINHAIKQHGKGNENRRDQIGLTKSDFIKINDITLGSKIIKKGNRIIHEKKIRSIYYYVEEIRTGRKQLALKTMYKKRATK